MADTDSQAYTDLAVDLPIKLLSPEATLPTLGSDFAAGLDLYSAEHKVVPARGKALIDLKLSVAVPKGHYGRIAPRSGLGKSMSDILVGKWLTDESFET
jgi:dUTP pyrophosphatase